MNEQEKAFRKVLRNAEQSALRLIFPHIHEEFEELVQRHPTLDEGAKTVVKEALPLLTPEDFERARLDQSPHSYRKSQGVKFEIVAYLHDIIEYGFSTHPEGANEEARKKFILAVKRMGDESAP